MNGGWNWRSPGTVGRLVDVPEGQCGLGDRSWLHICCRGEVAEQRDL